LWWKRAFDVAYGKLLAAVIAAPDKTNDGVLYILGDRRPVSRLRIQRIIVIA
jgi:hypothetical protein